MAKVSKGGTYLPNPVGYRTIMNGGARGEVMSHCQSVGENLAASAAVQSGTNYVVDSIRGLNRVHTRVSTPPDWKEWHRERNLGALSLAVGNSTNLNARWLGGRGSHSYRSLASRVKAVSKSTNKGWKAIAGNRLAFAVNRAAQRR